MDAGRFHFQGREETPWQKSMTSARPSDAVLYPGVTQCPGCGGNQTLSLETALNTWQHLSNDRDLARRSRRIEKALRRPNRTASRRTRIPRMIVVICFLVAARTILHSPPFVVEPGTGWNLGTLFAPVVRGFSFYPFHYFAARGLSGLINYYGDFFFHLLFSPLTLILVAMALVVAFRKPQRRAECNDPTVNHLKFCNSCECVFDPATGRYYPFDDADQFTKRYL